MIFKNKLLILSVVAIVILAFLGIYYSEAGLIFKEKVAKWRLERCLNSFDMEKLDITDQKIWFDDELGYEMFNSLVADAFLRDNWKECLFFENKKAANSLFYPELCWSRLQNIKMFYDFAEKLKAKIAEQDFLKECQSFLLDQMVDFKKEVPEKLRDERSKAFCQSVYSSYQKGAIIILNDAFVKDTIDSNPPICDCFDAEGKQRICQHEFCRTMGFFAAVSKNDQSLCPKLDGTKDLPYCNLYFDKEVAKKYNNAFKQNYCHKK